MNPLVFEFLKLKGKLWALGDATIEWDNAHIVNEADLGIVSEFDARSGVATLIKSNTLK